MEDNQEYYVFNFNIPQYIQVLRNSHPELNTDKWVERVEQIDALFHTLKYLGFRGETFVEGSDIDSEYKNYLKVEPVVFEADHGIQPDDDLKDLVDTDPELRIILGYDHPSSGIASLLEQKLRWTLKIFMKRKDEIVQALRDAVAAETDLSKINESIQRFETALVYNELAGFYEPIKLHLQTRFNYLKRAEGIGESLPVEDVNTKAAEGVKYSCKAFIIAIDALNTRLGFFPQVMKPRSVENSTYLKEIKNRLWHGCDFAISTIQKELRSKGSFSQHTEAIEIINATGLTGAHDLAKEVAVRRDQLYPGHTPAREHLKGMHN